MAFSHYYPFLVTLFIFYLFINPAMSDPDTQTRINDICRQMEEFGFCFQTFNQNLQNPTTDYVGLTEIAIQQATQKATNTHDYIVTLLNQTTDPAVKNVLTACENGYHVVEQAFKDGYKSFLEEDYDSMLQYERITPRAQGSCETSFNTPPNPTNPLVDRNRQMRILIAMAIVTGHQLSS